jgi:hypothetical protein
MNTVVVAFWVYNLAFIVEGRGSKLNFLGLVLLSVVLLGRLTLLLQRRGPELAKFWRRLGVFFLGGFICSKCGDAQIKLGGRWMPCFSCPSCGQFFFLSPNPKMQVKKMWNLVWRWKR